ncbi:MAG TPA: GTP cyclohydrolase I FolE [Bdellovibrionales bacterium]|nr:GTP cyclohydrolase I FolE [Bdellovibrionales bacterium]|tara:strand:+ start:4507 stop:5145 length:639 start_codon:yes stop_codon:yes gene_type:complete
MDPFVKNILDGVYPTPMTPNSLTDEEKIQKITESFKDIMETLGLDLTNDSLQDTPRRVAKMYVQEIFSGLNPENFPRITSINNELRYNEMVTVKDISIISVCEHHFVTIDGKATISYIPKDKVIGLSKINRVAKFFSRRPQVQERLTKQIADGLSAILETQDVAVHIAAKHYCVVQRGIEDVGSSTVTTDLRGAFREDSKTRSEFLHMCGRP